MNEQERKKEYSAFSLGYEESTDQAALLAYHVPGPGEKPFSPHWEPVFFINWQETPGVLHHWLESWERLNPQVVQDHLASEMRREIGER